MVRSEILDLESADDEQLDLFYLVNCVLDEIELAKQTADNGTTPEENSLNMPIASEEFYTSDLMDQLESPQPYSDSDASYTSHDNSSYVTNRSYQHCTDTYQSLPADLTEELLQKDIETEYFSFMNRREDTHEIPLTNETRNGFLTMDPYRDVHEERSSNSFPMQTVPSFCEYEQKSENGIKYCDVQKDIISKTIDLDAERNGFTYNKDLSKEFNDLQQYSDLIQTHEMVQSGPAPVVPTKAPVTQTIPTSSSQTHFYSEDSNDTSTSEFVSWTCKHPENWSTTEVLDWLYYSAERNGIDCSLLRGESFRTVTGAILCKMGPDEFNQVEPNYGQFLYKLFRQLLNGLRFTLPPDVHATFQEQTDLDTYYTDSQGRYYDNSRTSREPVQSQYSAKPLIHEQMPSQTSPDVYHQYQPRKESYGYEYGNSSLPISFQNGVESLIMQSYEYPAETQDNKYDQTYGYEYPVDSCYMPVGDQFRRTQSKVAAVRAKYEDGVTPVRRRPGRPRIKSIPTEEELQAQREKKMKSQHLWEFIFEILNNPAYNPSVLKWENQSEGVFRFIQSESVAQLWGTLKSNENMTYEKLSRAMRHYYKRGILERVEGRRLVYKFSRVTLDKMKEKRAAKGQ